MAMIIMLTGFTSPITKTVIYTIGDSTMANKTTEVYPETGWGQVLQLFVGDSLLVSNHAVNGRSTKSFIREGRWKAVVEKLSPGDYVLIQFGHNDQKEQDSSRFTNPYTAYRNNLIRFITETRERGATPVLLTPIVRRNFNEKGTLVDTHGAYPEVMRQVADACGVKLIDLQLHTEEMVIRAGVEGSKTLYLHVNPGEYPGYPQGKEDNTHLSETGAKKVAEMVARELFSKSVR
ncbi:MAG: rhamnogalacturonan acetylesterase [Bacteroidales bacterium]|nr:rhamnogalacturonan acetylesterase [Bacteroidales bacterium]